MPPIENNWTRGPRLWRTAKMIPPALDRLLAQMAVEIDAVAICTVGTETAITIRPLQAMEVHFILEGTLFLSIEQERLLALGPGSVIVVPPGRAQRMAGSATATRDFNSSGLCRTRPDGLALYDATEGGDAAVRIICGEIRADVMGICRPFADLAGPIAADLGDDPLIRAAFDAMSAEAVHPAPGSRALCGGLMKACLVALLRRHIADHGTVSLPGIFAKPWLGRVVSSVLDAPADAHSVASLATCAGRSRSVFAREFSESFELAPMAFVTEVRLSRASTLLQQTTRSIAEIAADVGFASRSHFSRAFRNAYGADPTTWRRDYANGRGFHARTGEPAGWRHRATPSPSDPLMALDERVERDRDADERLDDLQRPSPSVLGQVRRQSRS